MRHPDRCFLFIENSFSTELLIRIGISTMRCLKDIVFFCRNNKEILRGDKELKLLKVTGIIFIILLIPIFVAVLMHIDVFSRALGDANGWLGYWGGYLGALIGAATVYIVTTMQLRTQRKLHEQNLKEQFDLHNSNLVHQRKLQMESIKISADINDLRERDLIIANLRINKLDTIIQELIIVNKLNSDRFNILNTYNQYNHIRKKLNIQIKKERERRDLIKFLRSIKEIRLSTQYLLIPKTKVNRKMYKKIDWDKVVVRRNKYSANCDDLLDKETEKRNEIRVSSAKIKSEGLIVKIDDELDSFRGFQTNVLNLFQTSIISDTLSERSFKTLLETHEKRFLVENNKVINLCADKLTGEIKAFKKN